MKIGTENLKLPSEKDHISEYKRKIMTYLSTNKQIVELCGGEFGKKQNGRIFFPYEYVPETIEETFCGVCFDVESQRGEVAAYDTMLMYFFIFCHYGMASAPDLPGLRYDMIAHQITRDLDDKPFFGIGKCQLRMNQIYVARRMAREMRGRVLTFTVTDFSQGLYNRKNG